MKKRPMDRAAFRKYCRKRLLHLHDLFQQIDTSRNQEIDEDDGTVHADYVVNAREV